MIMDVTIKCIAEYDKIPEIIKLLKESGMTIEDYPHNTRLYNAYQVEDNI
jgi:hypothetical protein